MQSEVLSVLFVLNSCFDLKKTLYLYYFYYFYVKIEIFCINSFTLFLYSGATYILVSFYMTMIFLIFKKTKHRTLSSIRPLKKKLMISLKK